MNKQKRKVYIIRYKYSFKEIASIIIYSILSIICLAAIGYGIYLVARVIPRYYDYYVVQGNKFSVGKFLLYFIGAIFIIGIFFMDGELFNTIFASAIALIIFIVMGVLLSVFISNIKYYIENKKKIDNDPFYYGYYYIINDNDLESYKDNKFIHVNNKDCRIVEIIKLYKDDLLSKYITKQYDIEYGDYVAILMDENKLLSFYKVSKEEYEDYIGPSES